jgi:acyl-CoA thioesterase-2
MPAPADFEADTRVRGGDGRYAATLSPAWEVWGPFGGYVAAVALRGLAAASELPRPASFSCLFLSVARFGEVDLAVATLRRGRSSHALRVDVTQEGRPVLAASAWFVADALSGLEHEDAVMPAVPPPAELPSYAERAPDYDAWYPIWRSIEGRPLRWSEEPGPPVWRTWMRLQRTPDLARDPVLDAARSLLWMDIMPWNAAAAPHTPWPLSHIAPSLDLSVLFHRGAAGEEWLLCDCHAPVSREGLVGCTGRLWTPGGRLVASGTSHLTWRPAPQAQG